LAVIVLKDPIPASRLRYWPEPELETIEKHSEELVRYLVHDAQR
jgi:hypothetical protein